MKAKQNADVLRRFAVGTACLGLTMLGGCHHRDALPPLPAIVQARILAPPTPSSPGMEEPLSDVFFTVPPVKVTEVRPRRSQRRSASRNPTPETATPPDSTSIETAPEDLPIGELSSGGDSTPRTQQDATELIASSEHRLSRVPPAVVRQQQEQLRQVRNFLRQAKQALKTGDAEGAKTLATKAKLLMDDLSK